MLLMRLGNEQKKHVKSYLRKFSIEYNCLFQIIKLKYFLMDMMTIQILFLSIMQRHVRLSEKYLKSA